jgi:hypothetical protein
VSRCHKKTDERYGVVMMEKTGSAKVVICFSLIVLAIALSAGCTSNSAYKEAMNNEIVSCSHFSKIIDDYRTPEGRYIVIEGYPEEYIAETINLDLPGNLKGKYVACVNFNGCSLLNLTPLSESETGMRDACRVDP